MKTFVFDTEDDGAGNFLQGGVYDGERVLHFATRETMGAWIASTPGRYWTFNLEYDLVALFWPDLARVAMWRSNGRILSARVGSATFSDLVWSMGGVGMRFCAELIGMEKGELDARSRAYLENDLLITWAVLHRMQAELLELGVERAGGTLAGASMRVFLSISTLARDKKGRPMVPPFPPALESTARACYYGGRTECFDYRELTVDGFDVNSMFPAVMAGHVFPMGRPKPTRSLARAWTVTADVDVPECHVPPLPWRTERLIFPVGRLTATWTGEELRHAVGAGVRVRKILSAWTFTREVQPFDAFCATLFERRKHDAFSNYYCKRLMNSLYGKLAQDGDLEYVTGTLEALESKPLAFARRNYFPLWSAVVTARARVILHQYLTVAGGDLVYCDTDSVFSAYPGAERFATGAGLGELKREHSRARIKVLAPKLYRLQENGETCYRSRGVNEAAAKEFFESGAASYPKPMRLFEAIRRGMKPNVWDRVTKSFGADAYDKRERLPDGRTQPLVVDSKGELWQNPNTK